VGTTAGEGVQKVARWKEVEEDWEGGRDRKDRGARGGGTDDDDESIILAGLDFLDFSDGGTATDGTGYGTDTGYVVDEHLYNIQCSVYFH
jgi:hypothetical protein